MGDGRCLLSVADCQAMPVETLAGSHRAAAFEGLIKNALQLLNAERAASALIRVDRAIRLQAPRPELLLLKGACLERLGLACEAIECYVNGMKHAPDFVPLMRALILVSQKSRDIPAEALVTVCKRLHTTSTDPGDQEIAAKLLCEISTHQLPRARLQVRHVVEGGDCSGGLHMVSDRDCGGESLYAPETIDIIIPVYRDFELTRNCILSVLASSTALQREIVVINDASPEPEMASWLRSLAKRGLITLLENSQNRGFILAVNRGIALHPERDVVLLNADAEVSGDWLDRMRAAAYREDRIASVTPLSNNGEHFSFPIPFNSGVMPSSAQLASLHLAAAQANDGQSIDVPFGIGFCLFLRRACLQEIGYLDDLELKRGYGEEVDLCLRASAAGWRHVCSMDVFVAHKGNVSFKDEKALLVRNNNHLIRMRHPDGRRLYREFVSNDPIREFRRAIETKMLGKRHFKTLIVAQRSTASYSLRNDLLRRYAHDENGFLVLLPIDGERANYKLFGYAVGSPQNLTYQLPEEMQEMLGHLCDLQVREIHYHDTAAQIQEILQLPELLQVPYQLFPKDYSLYCPQKFLSPGNRYCGDPLDVATCERCVARNDWLLAQRSPTLSSYRAQMMAFATASEKIVISDNSAAIRFARRFPNCRIEFRSPPDFLINKPRSSRYCMPRIAVVGPLHARDGYGGMLQLARCCASAQTPLDFVVLGETLNDAALMATGKVWVTGPLEGTESPLELARIFQPVAALHLASLADIASNRLRVTQELGVPVFIWNQDVDTVETQESNALGLQYLSAKTSASEVLKVFLTFIAQPTSRSNFEQA